MKTGGTAEGLIRVVAGVESGESKRNIQLR
jgi:hypothetical protein